MQHVFVSKSSDIIKCPKMGIILHINQHCKDYHFSVGSVYEEIGKMGPKVAEFFVSALLLLTPLLSVTGKNHSLKARIKLKSFLLVHHNCC